MGPSVKFHSAMQQKTVITERKGGCSSPLKEIKVFDKNGIIRERKIDNYIDNFIDEVERYDSKGKLANKSTFSKTKDNEIIEKKYDAKGNLLSNTGTISYKNAVEKNRYNKNGQRVEQSTEFLDGEKKKVQFRYDTLGRQVKVDFNETCPKTGEFDKSQTVYTYYGDSNDMKSKNVITHANEIGAGYFSNTPAEYVEKQKVEYNKSGKITLKDSEKKFVRGKVDSDYSASYYQPSNSHTLETYKYNCYDQVTEANAYKILNKDTIPVSKKVCKYNILGMKTMEKNTTY